MIKKALKAVLATVKQKAEQRVTVADEFSTDLALIRGRIFEARREISAIAIAPVDRATAQARVEAIVAALAAPVQEKMTKMMMDPALSTASAVDALNVPRMSAPVGGDCAMWYQIRFSAMEILAASDPDKCRAVLLSGFTERADALSIDIRPQMIRALEDEIDALSQTEESIIRQADAIGMSIARRDDVDPKWVLAPDSYLEA